MIFMIFLTVSIPTEAEAIGLSLIGILHNRGTKAMIGTVMEVWKGAPQRLLLQGLLSSELLSTPAAGIQHFLIKEPSTRKSAWRPGPVL